MIERRPLLDFLTHLALILGVVIVAFPVYVVFVASSLTAEDVLQAPMTLIPGPHLIDNYREVLAHGMGNSATPVGTMLMNSLIMALGISLGKIAISILSAFAIVYFRFPLRKTFFWLIFVTLMLPWRCASCRPTRWCRTSACSTATSPDHSDHRLGHGHIPVPPVLPDDSRRTGRGRAHRRRRAAQVLLGRGVAAVAHPASRRCS